MAKDRKQGKRGLNIIIVGCGKVGASLTEQLYKEGHDITLVDRSSERLQVLTDKRCIRDRACTCAGGSINRIRLEFKGFSQTA